MIDLDELPDYDEVYTAPSASSAATHGSATIDNRVKSEPAARPASPADAAPPRAVARTHSDIDSSKTSTSAPLVTADSAPVLIPKVETGYAAAAAVAAAAATAAQVKPTLYAYLMLLSACRERSIFEASRIEINGREHRFCGLIVYCQQPLLADVKFEFRDVEYVATFVQVPQLMEVHYAHIIYIVDVFAFS